MQIDGDLVGAGARASAVGASDEVTVGATSAPVTGDTWAGTGEVLGGPGARVWAEEVVDQGAVVDLPWAVAPGPEAVVVDLPWAVEADREAVLVGLLWAGEAVVAGRVEAPAEVAERGPEAAPRVLVEGAELAVEAAALVVAEPVVVAEALAVQGVVAEAAVAARFSRIAVGAIKDAVVCRDC
jgi:hypothetical protein